ncbi:MAG: YbaB/EbfC family nucleoid-associated protein [Candidatus Omnitrophica bacterium]|nr:YbaB/EbfC family nucleoid-associated protein [Candidatus Omnitrophota bacterium]MCB9719439.1 YbaB/EbfC family nucleoid-associated protein [Candidatus Omnitrophota bacterium]
MFDKVKQMMEMKRQADTIKKELESTFVEVEEINGLRIRISGAQKFKGIQFDEKFLEGRDNARLEKDLLRCLNAAIKKSQQVAAEKMKSVMPGGFPGM